MEKEGTQINVEIHIGLEGFYLYFDNHLFNPQAIVDMVLEVLEQGPMDLSTHGGIVESAINKRRMSGWAKSALAESISSVCRQRNIENALVSCAYTSQMDSRTGLLKGKRVGDKFYCENGDVLDADFNAAMNVRSRYFDKEITLYTPFWKLKESCFHVLRRN